MADPLGSNTSQSEELDSSPVPKDNPLYLKIYASVLIAVVPKLKNKRKSRSSFSVRKEGIRPSLVIEVRSPHYPDDDTEKVTS